MKYFEKDLEPYVPLKETDEITKDGEKYSVAKFRRNQNKMLFSISVLLLLLLALAVTFVFFGVGWARILQDESNSNLSSSSLFMQEQVKGQLQSGQQGYQFPFNFTCPTEKSIAPCRCYFDRYFEGYTLECEGRNVTQQVLAKVMATVRQVNKVRPSQILSLGMIFLHNFPLTKMSLTPFFNTNMTNFLLGDCPKLASILCPTIDNFEGSGSIQAQMVAVYSTPLMDQSIGAILEYFEPRSLVNLDLRNNRITGGQYVITNRKVKGVEFLPGLSQFTGLNLLDLSGNSISRLEGGQFKRNVNLRGLMLEDNGLGLGRGAFDIGGSWAGSGTIIGLENCKLRVEAFDRINVTGLLSPIRSFSLFLGHNFIQTLPNATVGQFLRVNRNNKVDLDFNPLICDRRLSWLRRDPKITQNQVTQAFCSNDRGNTVWNSSFTL